MIHSIPHGSRERTYMHACIQFYCACAMIKTNTHNKKKRDQPGGPGPMFNDGPRGQQPPGPPPLSAALPFRIDCPPTIDTCIYICVFDLKFSIGPAVQIIITSRRVTPYTTDHFRSNTCRRIKESKMSVSEDKNITKEALLYTTTFMCTNSKALIAKKQQRMKRD